MKAPNKIYVREYPEGLNQMWSGIRATETSAIAQHEYIRKDALLEWAKEVHDSGPIKDSADKGDAWSIGYLCGMRDIIDKLK